MEKISPCPFCGGSADTRQNGVFGVYCNSCGARGPGMMTEGAAIYEWNAVSRGAQKTFLQLDPRAEFGSICYFDPKGVNFVVDRGDYCEVYFLGHDGHLTSNETAKDFLNRVSIAIEEKK